MRGGGRELWAAAGDDRARTGSTGVHRSVDSRELVGWAYGLAGFEAPSRESRAGECGRDMSMGIGGGRLARGVACIAMALTFVVASGTARPSEAEAANGLFPILDCVTYHEVTDTVTARFGFSNTTGVAQQAPIERELLRSAARVPRPARDLPARHVPRGLRRHLPGGLRRQRLPDLEPARQLGHREERPEQLLRGGRHDRARHRDHRRAPRHRQGDDRDLRSLLGGRRDLRVQPRRRGLRPRRRPARDLRSERRRPHDPGPDAGRCGQHRPDAGITQLDRRRHRAGGTGDRLPSERFHRPRRQLRRPRHRRARQHRAPLRGRGPDRHLRDRCDQWVLDDRRGRCRRRHPHLPRPRHRRGRQHLGRLGPAHGRGRHDRAGRPAAARRHDRAGRAGHDHAPATAPPTATAPSTSAAQPSPAAPSASTRTGHSPAPERPTPRPAPGRSHWSASPTGSTPTGPGPGTQPATTPASRPRSRSWSTGSHPRSRRSGRRQAAWPAARHSSPPASPSPSTPRLPSLRAPSR